MRIRSAEHVEAITNNLVNIRCLEAISLGSDSVLSHSQADRPGAVANPAKAML
jgi:hypothetical protein